MNAWLAAWRCTERVRSTMVLCAKLLICMQLLACGISATHKFSDAFSAAQRARTAGRHAEAAQHFAAAAQAASRNKDRNEARYLEARMYERLRRWPQATEHYRSLRDEGRWRAGRAAFDFARLEIEHGEKAAGYTALAIALRRFPDHGTAHHALRRWIEHLRETGGESRVRTALSDWLAPLADTELYQQLLYEIARSLERDGQLTEARSAFIRCAEARPYPRGSFTDDAYWHASNLAEALGQYPLAIADLETMLRDLEQSNLLFGSYERPRFPAAQMRIAELYRDRVGDLDAARKAFYRAHQLHPASVLADDAMWQEAAMWRRLGDTAEACGVLTDFIERFSRSRYVSCVAEICPHLKPPVGARTHCPAYIKRALHASK
jgi:tetratricopeptide (TPR) repeat protein